MTKHRKLNIAGICTLFLIAAGLIVSTTSSLSNSFLKTFSNPSEYCMELNKNNKFTEDEAGTWDNPKTEGTIITRKTTSGNDINFIISGSRSLTSVENNVCIIRNNGGWFCNETPLSGLYKIEINCSEGQTIRLDFGSTLPLDGYNYSQRPDKVSYRTNEYTGSSSYSISLPEGQYFSYFRLQGISVGNNWIGSFKMYYTCFEQHVHSWEHVDRIPANRGNNGLDEHYICNLCGALLDKNNQPTTIDNITLTSVLYTEDACEQQHNYELDRSIGLNEIITIDVLVEDDGVANAVYISLSDSAHWARTSNIKVYIDGSWEFTDTVGQKKNLGVTKLGTTEDNYFRFELDLSLMDVEAGATSFDRLTFYKWKHNSAKVEINAEGIALLRGYKYLGGKDYSVNLTPEPEFDLLTVNIDVLFIGDKPQSDSFLRIMLGDGWDSYFGYFKITRDGIYDDKLNTKLEFVTVSKLDDGFTRYSIYINDLYKAGIVTATTPKYFNLFYIHKWSKEQAYIDFSYVTHDHELEHFDRVEPFREATGNIEYYKCTDCGRYFNADMERISEEDTLLDSRLMYFDNTTFPQNGESLKINLDKEYQTNWGDTFIIDFKIQPDTQNEIGFLIGDNSDAYFGKFWVETKNNKDAKLQGSYGDGVTAALTTDGYLRVSVILDKTKIASNRQKNPDNITTFDYVEICPGIDYKTCTAEVEIMPVKGDIARGIKFTAGFGTINFNKTFIGKDYNVIVDVFFTSSISDRLSFIIGNWEDTQLGYFNLYPTSKTGDYDGLSVEILKDGYIRFSFNLKEVTKFNDGKTGSDTSIFKFLHIDSRQGFSTATGFIDIRYAPTVDDNPIMEDIYE